MAELKWIRQDMDLNKIDNNNMLITIENTGCLEKDFYNYAMNFFEAAEILISSLLHENQTDISKLDTWYFSVIYLYRQSLELLLKAIIFQNITDEETRINLIGKIRHDIHSAFNEILNIKNITIANNSRLDWLNKFLEDISKIDRQSDMFRYPFGSKEELLFENQTHISLKATKTNMNTAFNVLKDMYNKIDYDKKTYEAYSPKLINEGGNYYEQSVVGYSYLKKKYYPYYESYQETAKYLKYIIKKFNKPNLFMPMCYLYRNSLELGLKRIIIEDSHYETEKAYSIIRRKKHSILGLWNAVLTELNIHESYSNDLTIQNTQKYIEAFHEIDLSSDLFRYPCNKKLETYYKNEKQYDLENITNCFEELSNLLDGLDTMLANVKEYEAEMNAYYR